MVTKNCENRIHYTKVFLCSKYAEWEALHKGLRGGISVSSILHYNSKYGCFIHGKIKDIKSYLKNVFFDDFLLLNADVSETYYKESHNNGYDLHIHEIWMRWKQAIWFSTRKFEKCLYLNIIYWFKRVVPRIIWIN